MEVDEESEKKEENVEVDIDIQDGIKEKQEDVEMEDCNNIDNINECNEEDLIPHDPDAEDNNNYNIVMKYKTGKSKLY